MQSTISKEAKALIEGFADLDELPAVPAPDDYAAWAAQNEDYEAGIAEKNDAALKAYPVNVEASKLGGIPIVEVSPKTLRTTDKILIHFHGGCYCFFSAATTICATGPVANEAGLKVISVDYTLAPRAKWRDVYGEIEAVIRALLAAGYQAEDLCLFGESAGGALSAGTALMMRDKGLGAPAALCLLSPWSDIDRIGDSFETHADVEVAYVYERHLKRCALAYADPSEYREPWVSPVYGAYDANFPPTLLQGGTRELFLSHFVRHYQAMDQAGRRNKAGSL